MTEQGLRRRLRVVEPLGGTQVRVDGRVATLWCSNDYLGLANHPELMAAFHGGGAGAARLVSGNRPVHAALETALAERFGRPATLFPTGYQANLALAGTVLADGDIVASDALNHASIIDGLRLARGHRVIVPHARADAVPADARLIYLESLYSMDGDIPQLADYPSTPWMALDEAHAVGALGPDGRGIAAAQGAAPDFLVGTFGKAYGVAGAFVIGPPDLRELLLSTGRAFVYSTGMPEPVAAACLAGLRLADQDRRDQLGENTQRLRDRLARAGIVALGSAHIVPVVTGPRTMALAAALLDHGIFVAGIRYPTVARGEERLRFTVSAAHTRAEIDTCVDTLARLLRAPAV